MELTQASFQASFDARVDRLNATELAELRTIFQYFDTDSDGAVSANQACQPTRRVGCLLCRWLIERVDLLPRAEFLKIVDSHVPMPPPAPTTEAESAPATGDHAPMVPALHIGDSVSNIGEPLSSNNGDNAVLQAPGDEETVRQRNAQVWESEWKLLDTFRRGHIMSNELRLFLLRCGSAIPPSDLVRFLEMFGGSIDTASADDNANGDDHGHGNNNAGDAEHMVPTKSGFLRFRDEYTTREAAAAENGLDSGSDAGEDDEDEGVPLEECTARGGNGQDEHGSEAGDGAKARNPQLRGDGLEDDDSKSRTSRRSSSRLPSARDGIVVNRGVLDQSDESGMDDEDDGEEAEVRGDDESGDAMLFDGGAEDFLDN